MSMSCEHTRAVLTGEAPPTDSTDHLRDCADCAALAEELAAIDASGRALPAPPVPDDLIAATRAAMAGEVALEHALSALPLPPVPDDLIAATRAAMAAELAGEDTASDNVVPLWRRRSLWAAVAVAASVLLLIRPPTISPADPADLIEKGAGGARPDVALGVAVRSGDSTARLRLDRRYAPGDVLYFRSSTDRASEVLLVRIDAEGADVIHHDQLGPGERDLPLSWTLESGEGDAIFALLAGSGPVEAEQVTELLSRTWPDAPCEQAASLALSCESVFVGISAEQGAGGEP
jgi:hypothetical protein